MDATTKCICPTGTLFLLIHTRLAASLLQRSRTPEKLNQTTPFLLVKATLHLVLFVCLFSDSLVLTLFDPSKSFNLVHLSIQVNGVHRVTVIILAANGTQLLNETVSALPTTSGKVETLRTYRPSATDMSHVAKSKDDTRLYTEAFSIQIEGGEPSQWHTLHFTLPDWGLDDCNKIIILFDGYVLVRKLKVLTCDTFTTGKCRAALLMLVRSVSLHFNS